MKYYALALGCSWVEARSCFVHGKKNHFERLIDLGLRVGSGRITLGQNDFLIGFELCALNLFRIEAQFLLCCHLRSCGFGKLNSCLHVCY